MKFSRKWLVLLICTVVGILLLYFTPLGSYARVVAGRLRNVIQVANKESTKIPKETYTWQLKNRNGEIIGFEKDKGHVVFLNFWATWCAPCVKEMPGLQYLYNDYGDKVRFLFVAKDDRTKVSKFIAKNSYTLPVYYSHGEIPDTFFSHAVPTTFIIDKSGKIVLAQTSSADWNGKATRNLLDSLLLH